MEFFKKSIFSISLYIGFLASNHAWPAPEWKSGFSVIQSSEEEWFLNKRDPKDIFGKDLVINYFNVDPAAKLVSIRLQYPKSSMDTPDALIVEIIGSATTDLTSLDTYIIEGKTQKLKAFDSNKKEIPNVFRMSFNEDSTDFFDHPRSSELFAQFISAASKIEEISDPASAEILEWGSAIIKYGRSLKFNKKARKWINTLILDVRTWIASRETSSATTKPYWYARCVRADREELEKTIRFAWVSHYCQGFPNQEFLDLHFSEDEQFKEIIAPPPPLPDFCSIL